MKRWVFIFGFVFLMVFVVGSVKAFEDVSLILPINNTHQSGNCFQVETIEIDQSMMSANTLCFLPIVDELFMPASSFTFIKINGRSFLPSSTIGHSVYSGGDISNILNSSTTSLNVHSVSTDGDIFIGTVNILFYNDGNRELVEITGVIIEDNGPRISALESWKQTVTSTLSSITNSIASLLGKSDSHEDRIETLELNLNNDTSGSNTTMPDYFKYLSSRERKNIACGYGTDNHLDNVFDLGWNCTITYRQTSRGETSSCRCKSV